MSCLPWFRCGLFAVVLAILVPLVALGDDAPTSSTPKKHNPAGTGPIMTQLRSLFDSWDLNKDDYLDKEELAKAFRGPKAKPFDYKPRKKKDPDKDTAKDPKKDQDAAKDPKENKDLDKDLLKNEEPDKDAAKDLKKDKDPDKDAVKPKSETKTNKSSKPDYSKYPDYLFLQMVDKNGDEKISRAEFETWARSYAVALKKQINQAARIAKAEDRLLRSTSTNVKNQIQAELNQERAALSLYRKEMKAYDKVVQEQMKAMKQAVKQKH